MSVASHRRKTGPGPNPSGFCMCGCGGRAKIATYSDNRPGKDTVIGTPKRFINGHHSRKRDVPESGYVVDSETGCWLWELKLEKHNGYGRVKRNGKCHMAHRWMWEQENGPVPEGMQLDHLCRNRRCVNPAHLEPVTPTVNVRRSSAAKLTSDDASVIRRMVRDGWSVAWVAVGFGVSSSAVHRIVRGQGWRP